MKSFALLFITLSSIELSLAFDCGAYDIVYCPTDSCSWVGNSCVCKNDVKQDIFFSIDASGSITYDGFQEAKAWLSELVYKSIPNGTRMAFETYSTDTNYSTWSELKFWEREAAKQLVNTMEYTGGWTSTDLVTIDMMAEFNRTEEQDRINDFDNARQRINFLITDGNPCRRSECPYDVCYVGEDIFRSDIRVILIGVGMNLNPENLYCLLENEDTDYLFVANYSEAAFNAIFDSLSDIFCPVTYTLLITEVKPENTARSSPGDADKNVRFLEIWNSGTPLNLTHVNISGLISYRPSRFWDYSLIVQNSYFVFYDATTGSTYPNVTCAQCDSSSCDHPSGCSEAGPPCHCQQALYIECGNCNTNGDLTAYGCCFHDYYNKTNWYVQVDDIQNTNGLLDEVVYDSSWLIIEDGYAYELLSKGFDNDLGDNWGQSCNNLGTPGADPGVTCSRTCSDTTCNINGANNASCSGSFNCDCTKNPGYYVNGITCSPVPQPGSCTVQWTKINPNISTSRAYFKWEYAATSQSIGYKLEYWDKTSQGDEPSYQTTYSNYMYIVDYFEIDEEEYAYHTFYEKYYNTSLGVAAGYVYAYYVVGSTTYYSLPIPCILSTDNPTTAPTNNPTSDPTLGPTTGPTLAPTYDCVHFYFLLDCQEEPRCECFEENQVLVDGTASWDCCSDPADYSGGGDKCKYRQEEITGDGVKNVQVNREPKDFPFTSQVCWQLGEGIVINSSDSSDDGDGRRRRRLSRNLLAQQKLESKNGHVFNLQYFVPDEDEYQEREERLRRRRRLSLLSNTNDSYNAAGILVTPTSGCLVFSNTSMNSYEYVRLLVESISCADKNGDSDGDSDSDSDDDDDDECFDHISEVRYDLNLTNCSNSYDSNDCCEINYPDYLMLVISRDSTLSVTGSGDEELPEWLWWLIAALAIFLIVLAFLVYKFWWSARKSGKALNETKAELDDAVGENELGFGNDLAAGNINFNPLGAGGFGANPAGNAGAGPGGNNTGQANDIARVQDERLVFKQQFGARQN